MGCVCSVKRGKHVAVQQVFESSLFLQLIDDASTQTIIRHTQMRRVETEASSRTSIVAETGQLVVIFDGRMSLFDAKGNKTLTIRAYMPLASSRSIKAPPNRGFTSQLQETADIVLTSEVFLFWNSENEVICRYVVDGKGDEVILHSTMCARVELETQSRYLLLSSRSLLDVGDSRMSSSLNALTNADFIALIGTIPFFANLPKDKLSLLTEMSTIRVYPSNSVIFREDEGISTQLFVTLAGSLEVTSSRSTGPLATLEAGSFFGEMSLLINIPRAATVRSLESCMLMSIEKKAFQALLNQCPDVRSEVNKLLKERLLVKAVLSGVLPFFESVPNDRMISFSHELEIEDQIHKGDIVARQLDEKDVLEAKFVFLVYGAVEVTSMHRRPSDFKGSVFLTPGCYLGPFTFERMNLRKGKAIARSSAVLLTCPFSKLQSLLKEYPTAGAAANIAWFGERCDFTSVLRHDFLTQRFQAFLEAEHSDENFLFFTEIEKFRDTADPKKRQEHSQYIRERYIEPEAPKEVNLPAGIRDDIIDRLNKLAPNDNVDVAFFDEACTEIIHLMTKDSFPRFKKSLHFQNVVDALDPHTNRKNRRLIAACHHFRDSIQILRPDHVEMKNTQLDRMMSMMIQKSQVRRNVVSGLVVPSE